MASLKLQVHVEPTKGAPQGVPFVVGMNLNSGSFGGLHWDGHFLSSFLKDPFQLFFLLLPDSKKCCLPATRSKKVEMAK